jgi:hypothetical protein
MLAQFFSGLRIQGVEKGIVKNRLSHIRLLTGITMERLS